MARPQYPPKRQGVTRITQSALETYLRCGLRWKFERESRHDWATVRMAVGTAVAAGTLHDNRSKMACGKAAKLDEIIEQAVTGYETEVETVEIPESMAEIVAGKDLAAGAARAYGAFVSPKILRVIAAESPIVAEVSEGLEIAGTPDYLVQVGQKDVGLGDEKTGGQLWTQDRADGARQLTEYGMLVRAKYGTYPKQLWIDSISYGRGKTPTWKAQRFTTTRSAEQYRALLEVIDTARRGMRAGICLPAPEGGYWCSEKWCPFWGQCPAVSGRRNNGER